MLGRNCLRSQFQERVWRLLASMTSSDLPRSRDMYNQARWKRRRLNLSHSSKYCSLIIESSYLWQYAASKKSQALLVLESMLARKIINKAWHMTSSSMTSWWNFAALASPARATREVVKTWQLVLVSVAGRRCTERPDRGAVCSWSCNSAYPREIYSEKLPLLGKLSH